MRHRLIALPLAALATLVLATVALAGGWAQVTVTDPPTDPPAGGQTTINLSVLQHGVTPVSWPRLTVVATDTTSGAVVRTGAQAEGPNGSYVATIVFPSAGDWTLTFDSPDLEMMGSAPITVAPPAAAAQAASTAAASTSQAFDAMPLLLLLVVVAVAIAIAALFVRKEHASRAAQVSART